MALGDEARRLNALAQLTRDRNLLVESEGDEEGAEAGSSTGARFGETNVIVIARKAQFLESRGSGWVSVTTSKRGRVRMGVERNSYGCTPKGRVALAWWVAMAMAGSLLSGAPNQAAAQGVTHERVAGNVWRVDGAVDVIAVQSGADGLLMVDTGYPFAQAGVEAALRDIAGTDRADLLLNTHYHHTFSNHIYGVDAQVVAHANVGRRMGATNLMGGQVVPAMPEAGRPTRTFTDSLTLTYNGEQVTLLHLPGAHTDGDVAVIFHGSGVVLTGDVYVPHMPWSDMDAGGDFSLLLPAVERLLQVVPRDALLVPGHGPTGTYDDLLAFRDMLESARGTVSDRSSEGTSLRGIQSGGLPSLASWQGEGVPEALFIETVYRAAVPALRTEGPTVLYENGRWFDGVGFTAKTMYSVDGVLTDILQGPPDRTVNLGDGWVVPPFGEAHTHMLGDTSQLAKQGRTFMDDGVFYAMVQDPAHEVTAVHRTFAADPGTVDVAYTQGVVTPSWGMIADMYGMFAGMGMYGEGATVDDIDGEILFRLDTLEDLERAWPGLLARNDRFIKVILAFTDEHDVRMADPERYDAEPPRYSARPGRPGRHEARPGVGSVHLHIGSRSTVPPNTRRILGRRPVPAAGGSNAALHLSRTPDRIPRDRLRGQLPGAGGEPHRGSRKYQRHSHTSAAGEDSSDFRALSQG